MNHVILKELGATGLKVANDSIASSSIQKTVKKVLSETRTAIEQNYPDAYLAPLFKNVTKCSKIREQIEMAGLFG